MAYQHRKAHRPAGNPGYNPAAHVGSINDGARLAEMPDDGEMETPRPVNDLDDIDVSSVQTITVKIPPQMSLVYAIFKKLVAEFWGTFFLVATIGLAAGQGAALAALAIGAALWSAIFAFGHVSGAHFNPAITLGVYVRGRINITEGLLYIGAQLMGAFSGAEFSNNDLNISSSVGFQCQQNSSYRCGAGFPSIQGDFALPENLSVPFSMEFFWTFFLVTVVLNAATTKRNAGNSFYGFAIGSVVLCGAVACGNISGGAFNPAVGTALPYVGGDMTFVWLYWIAPMLGGAAAGLLFFVTADWDADFKGEIHQGCVCWGKRGCLCSAKKL